MKNRYLALFVMALVCLPAHAVTSAPLVRKNARDAKVSERTIAACERIGHDTAVRCGWKKCPLKARDAEIQCLESAIVAARAEQLQATKKAHGKMTTQVMPN